MKSHSAVARLSDSELVASTRELVKQSQCFEADLLVHLGEIDSRELYAERAFPSMLAFCVGELGLSVDVAYSRIFVARAARALPAMIESLRSGAVHFTGLRLLVPHLTAENHAEVLARAKGKKKEEIEELIAELAPRPAMPTTFQEICAEPVVGAAPAGNGAASTTPPNDSASTRAWNGAAATAPGDPPSVEPSSTAKRVGYAVGGQKRDVVAPLSPNAFRIQFTGTRAFRDKLRKAQDLLPRRFRKGELGPVLELALDALIERVEKKRFAVGCKPRRQAVRSEATANSRAIPAAMRREVRLRDEGRCTYRDPSGRRCTATSNLEYHHVDGFARVRVHNADRITLMCRTHNQLEAKKMYGRQFMKRARASAAATRSRTSSRSRKPARSKPLLL